MSLETDPLDDDAVPPGWQLTRLPRAAVRAAREARLPATLLGPFLEALTAAAAAGQRLGDDQLAEYRRLGRVAAESGAPLPALVDLYLSALWRAWPDLPAVAEDGPTPVTVAGLRRAGLSVLRAADDAVAALCEGYSSAQVAAARAEADTRREFVDDLLTGSSDVGALLTRAAAFGIQFEAPHVVLVVRADQPFVEGRSSGRRVESALRTQLTRGATATGGGLLVATRLGVLVAVVPLPTQSTGEGTPSRTELIARLAGAAATELRRDDRLRWRIGVSRPRSGPAGVRAAFDEALRALEFAESLGWLDPVVHSDETLVHQVLARDTEAMNELIRATLLPLRDARGGAEPLLATLRAYFAEGAVSTAAARRLHLSVRALTYRLERIATLTGRDPAEPADRLALQAATVGQQLLGWPEATGAAD